MSAPETHVPRPGEAYRRGTRCGCTCFIIPQSVFERFAHDKKLTPEQRKYFADAVKFERRWRKTREATATLARLARTVLPTAVTAVAAAAPPSVLVFDCQHGTTLPGVPVPNPGASNDASAQRAFDETTAVVDFYRSVFGRNSLDNAGMTLISSIHYSVNYNNAAWTGSQMKYGDGDGNIFIDFTKSNDVIGHELTHGVTQFTAGFTYRNQAGGLNESMSDVFGSMFRQWQANQNVSKADWLIGKEIIGPGAIARGFTCLRDMSNPAAKHCLAPQPTKFSQYQDGMDPHESSGIPNFAFYKAAMAIGGKSWEKTGKVWYQALTGFAPSPNMKMSAFANRTRSLAGSLFPSEPAVKTAVNKAWTAVGL
jgi:Zn-dependent metalloprotease